MHRFFHRLMIHEEGATMMEYAIMLALISAALVTSLTTLSTALGSKFSSTTASLNAAS